MQITGEDTTLLTINFLDDLDGFNPGESFSLQTMDPDFVSALSLTVADLAGVTTHITFRDSSTLQGIMGFESGAEISDGLTLVPEPGTGVLLFAGLLALAHAGRRR